MRGAQAIVETEPAIADDPNNAGAYAVGGFWELYLGRSDDGFRPARLR
jgi:hypothetical protein